MARAAWHVLKKGKAIKYIGSITEYHWYEGKACKVRLQKLKWYG